MLTETAEIKLSSGEAVVIDGCDGTLAQHRWWRMSGYAARHRPGGGTVLLHREILGLELGDPRQADHINGNRLDNRRANLRIVTPAQNGQNRRAVRGASSGFRGVSWNGRQKKWSAVVHLRGRVYFLGYHDNEMYAARLCERFRRKHMPFAVSDWTFGPMAECECPTLCDGAGL